MTAKFSEKKPLPVIPADHSWQADHDGQIAAGPLALNIAGQTVMKNCRTVCDDLPDNLLLADKVRLFRKGGTAIFEGEGHFPFGSGLVLCQILRYGVNTLRNSTDIQWKANTPLKDRLQLQSFTMPGQWSRVLVIPAMTAQDREPQWHSLNPGASLEFSPCPLVLVFEDKNGQRLETGNGNDVWRWEKGLGLHDGVQVSSLKIEYGAEGLEVTRCLDVCPAPLPAAPGEEPQIILPEARTFRFNSYYAWSLPAGAPEFPATAAELVPNLAQGLKRQDLVALGPTPVLRIDFRKIAWPEQAGRDNDSSTPCWESATVQRLARRLIRQLADYSREGQLQLLGLTPGLCTSGKHCDKRKPANHWDHAAILDFAYWTRQRLGSNWIIDIPQDGIWRELPSLACLGAPAAFGLEDFASEADEEDEM